MPARDYHQIVDFGREMRTRSEERTRRLRIADLTHALVAASSTVDAITNMLVGVVGDESLDAATSSALSELAQRHAARAADLCACVAGNAPLRLLEAAE